MHVRGATLIILGWLLVGCSDDNNGKDPGTEGGPCYPNGTCNAGLTCASNTCVRLPDGGLPDLLVPDGPGADTPVPDGPVPDASGPDAPAPDAAVPDMAGDISSPDTAPPDGGGEGGAADALPDAKPCQSSADCDDGLSCTTDVCGVGGCVNVITGGFCVINDTCVTDATPNPANDCQKCAPLVDQKGWTDDDGKPCDDSVACTHTDTCSAGVCQGTSYTCDDGLTCTTDTCLGTGTAPAGCDFALQTGNCLIGGQCYGSGDTNPGGSGKCAPSIDPYAWTIYPAITKLIPADGFAGGTTPVVIVGEGFTAGAKVFIDGGAAIIQSVTVSSPVALSFVMPQNPYGPPYDQPQKVSVMVMVNTLVSNSVDFQYTVTKAMDATFKGSVLTAQTSAYRDFPSDPIEARVFAQGITDTTTGDSGKLEVEVGYGPVGKDPTKDAGFKWQAASFKQDGASGYDIYSGTLTVPLSMTYDVAFRVSQDSGKTWIYADTDETNLSYELAKAARLTATDAPAGYCQSSADCTASAYDVVCKIDTGDPTNNRCVECLAAADCAANSKALGPYCDTANARCYCSQATDCAANPNGHSCLSSGYCGCQASTDCDTGGTCTQTTGGLSVCQ